MIKKSRSENIHFLLVLILATFSLLLHSRISGLAFLAMGFIIWFIIYTGTKKKSSTEYALSKLIMLSIPLSFVSVINGSYGEMPISWFNIFMLFLTIILLLKKSAKNSIKISYLSIYALFMMVISVLPLLVASSFTDGLKQYLNIALVFLAIILGGFMRAELSLEEKDKLFLCYIQGVYIAAIGLAVQFLVINFIGMEVGYFSLFGLNRRAYAFLFSDFSFLSLYLSSGAMMIFMLGKKQYESTLKWLGYTILLLVASMLTSARTGIAAFLVVFMLYSLGRLLTLISKGSIKSILLILFNAIVLIGSYFILNRVRIGDLSGDSGRFVINTLAFEMFKKNPLLGVGFGVSTYGHNISTIPHNIFYQYLAQGGIIFTLTLIVFLFIVALIAWKKNKVLFWGYFSIIIGALFIPDIFSSRFLLGIMFLISINR